MEHLIKDLLKRHKKKTISNIEIQAYLPGDSDMGIFNRTIDKLIDEQLLIPFHSGRNYSINKHLLMKDKQEKIVQTQLALQSDIKLDAYLSLPESVWEAEYPYILMVDRYLMHPNKEEMSTPECAYLVTGNEKWIDEEGGKEILQRLGVWEQLPIVYYGEPLAITINRQAIHSSHKHLIVENKSIFYRASKVIQELPIASLIYGEGWHVTSGFQALQLQLGIKEQDMERQTFYYCGDLDWEGLAIWHSVSERAMPAVAFYRGMLQHSLSRGKTTQNQNLFALEAFLSYFEVGEQAGIKNMLGDGKYIPQEALSTEEIIQAGRLL